MPPDVLICMVGLPRSGKTTWARERGLPMVNPDSIRIALHGQRFFAPAEPFIWAIAKCMVNALFIAGHKEVIVDATNGSRKRRDFWQDDRWKTVFCVIDTPKEECIRRAEETDDNEIIPVIERMDKEREPLGPDEEVWGLK